MEKLSNVLKEKYGMGMTEFMILQREDGMEKIKEMTKCILKDMIRDVRQEMILRVHSLTPTQAICANINILCPKELLYTVNTINREEEMNIRHIDERIAEISRDETRVEYLSVGGEGIFLKIEIDKQFLEYIRTAGKPFKVVSPFELKMDCSNYKSDVIDTIFNDIIKYCNSNMYGLYKNYRIFLSNSLYKLYASRLKNKYEFVSIQEAPIRLSEEYVSEQYMMITYPGNIIEYTFNDNDSDNINRISEESLLREYCNIPANEFKVELIESDEKFDYYCSLLKDININNAYIGVNQNILNILEFNMISKPSLFFNKYCYINKSKAQIIEDGKFLNTLDEDCIPCDRFMIKEKDGKDVIWDDSESRFIESIDEIVEFLGMNGPYSNLKVEYVKGGNNPISNPVFIMSEMNNMVMVRHIVAIACYKEIIGEQTLILVKNNDMLNLINLERARVMDNLPRYFDYIFPTKRAQQTLSTLRTKIDKFPTNIDVIDQYARGLTYSTVISVDLDRDNLFERFKACIGPRMCMLKIREAGVSFLGHKYFK